MLPIMKKNMLTIALLLCLSSANLFAQNNKISALDIKPLIGFWKGSLTYLDYQTNKPYTMPADLEITQIEESNRFVFSNIYPNEPKANDADTVTISESGLKIDDEIITLKRKKNGRLEITTELTGEDGNDNKAAIIRHIYTIGTNEYVVIKEVKFVDETKWIKRHEYRYQKN